MANALEEPYWDHINRRCSEVTGGNLLQGLTPETAQLGMGTFGVVYRTNHPFWVIKVTEDPSEAPAFEAVRQDELLSESLGVVCVGGVWETPEGDGIILREAVTPMPEVPYAARSLAVDQLWKTVTAAEQYNLGADPDEFDLSLIELESHYEMSHLADFMGLFYELTGIALDDLHPGNLGRRDGDRALVAFDLGCTVQADVAVPLLIE